MDNFQEIKNIEAIKVFFVNKVGPYEKSCTEAWDELMVFANKHELMQKGAKGYGISHDDPKTVPAEKIRYDACVSYIEGIEPEGSVGVKEITAGEYAIFLHKGPYEKLGDVYNKAYAEWLPASGKKARQGACFEQYLNNPKVVEPQEYLTQIHIPVE
ncbi:MAG: GyrI-like domain-containing protein [Vampirovibrionia bacterium]